MSKKITLMCNGKKLEITPLTGGVIEEASQRNSSDNAPGRGAYEISEPVLSADSLVEGESISCKVAVRGKNISQISLELMLQVNSHKIGPIQTEFLQSPKNREVKGVVHPHWMTENEIEFSVTPGVRLLCCGEGFTLACMSPERYGVSPEAQIWSLEGVYQRGGGEPFRAKFEFDHQGALVRKTGFYPVDEGGVVAPFELLIEEGDTFEPFVTLIDDDGEVTSGTVNPIMLGGGNQLRWEQIDVCSGVYLLGVVVEDFDGHKTRKHAELSIKS